MAGHEPNFTDIDKITSLKDVVGELVYLNIHLEKIGLNQFKLFNSSYYIVTTSVQQAIEDNYFDNPEFIEKFIVAFARYYFKAVIDTEKKSLDLSLPWLKVNEYATNKSAPKFISLMLGASAHINNDLPQVLNTLMQNEDTEALLSDIVKIDKLLMESGKEIIKTFEETNKVLSFLKRNFQFMYYRPAMYTIRYWRIIAWKNYRKLKKQPSYIQSITNRSVKIANRWLKLSGVLS